MRYLIFGNPNAGKTTVYNALTSSSERTGNWHGVTVDPVEKRVGEDTFVDVPGVYSLTATSPEEISAIQSLKGDATVLNVIDATNLRQGLALTEELKGERKKVVILLTKLDELQKRGGSLNEKELSRRLSVPVFPVEKHLLDKLKGVKGEIPRFPCDLDGVYMDGKKTLSKVERLFFSPLFSTFVFFCAVLLAFFLTFSRWGIGTLLKGLIERFFSFLASFITSSVSFLPLRSFLRDGLLGGIGSVLSFLPQLLLLELFLRLMEESGFLSIFAFTADPFFRKIGLSGRAVFSLLMGFGCTGAAIKTCKAHEKQMRGKLFSAFPFLSCSAKMPVYVTLFSSFFPRPFLPVLLITLFGVVLAVLVLRLQKTCDCTPSVFEVAPLSFPRANDLLKSLCFSAKSFIIKVAGFILAFLMLSWFFSSFDFTLTFVEAERSMLASLCKSLRFVFVPIGMTDWKMVYAFLSGLIAKENVAGMISLFYPNGLPFSLASVTAFAVMILTTSPCISSVMTLSFHVGKKKALLWFLKQSLIGLLLGYLTYPIMSVLGGIL